MRLYYMSGACSLSPHIVANEAGIPMTFDRLDRTTRRTESGKDFNTLNPKGYVPALELDDGTLLTEGPAIVQYLADLRPESGLAPPNGTVARYQLQSMLTYIGTELHKTFSPLFNPATVPETRAERAAYLQKRYAWIDKALDGHEFLLGDHFTVADAYLFAVTGWADRVKVDLSSYRNLAAFMQRVAQRPAVIKSMQEEGLLG
jgi:glutathione S-transferase